MEELRNKIIENIDKRIETEKDLLNRLDLIILKVKLKGEDI